MISVRDWQAGLAPASMPTQGSHPTSGMWSIMLLAAVPVAVAVVVVEIVALLVD